MRYKLIGQSGPVRIASTSGHITLLTDEFKEVPAILEPEARKVGAIAEEQFDQVRKQIESESSDSPPQVDRKERAELIELACNEMIDEGNPNNMTTAGRPKVDAVERKTGLTDVKAKEIEDVWAKITGDNF